MIELSKISIMFENIGKKLCKAAKIIAIANVFLVVILLLTLIIANIVDVIFKPTMFVPWIVGLLLELVVVYLLCLVMYGVGELNIKYQKIEEDIRNINSNLLKINKREEEKESIKKFEKSEEQVDSST